MDYGGFKMAKKGKTLKKGKKLSGAKTLGGHGAHQAY